MSVHRPTVVHHDWFRLMARSWKPKPATCPACAGRKVRVVGFEADPKMGDDKQYIVGKCPDCRGTGREGRDA